MPEGNVFDHQAGKPRVLSEQCTTCVFRPGNPMRLREGRLADLIEENRAAGAGLTCHQTLTYAGTGADNAWCRGFFDAFPDTSMFQVAARLFGDGSPGSGVVEVAPPK